MTRLFLVVALAVAAAGPAHADDRAAIGDSLAKVASTAEALARTAGSSDDPAVRKKLAPKATELGIDLAALAHRAHKDVPLKAIANDARAIAKDTAQLVELTDEAEDKTQRKALRAQAMLLDQQVAAARKLIDDAAAAKPAAVAPLAPRRPVAFTADRRAR